MGLEQALLGLGLAERISYDAERNTLFPNLEGFQVRTIEDVELIRREMEPLPGDRPQGGADRQLRRASCSTGGHDAYFSTITYLQGRYYETASRYTTSAFLRLKLGSALWRSSLAPHVFETLPEAQASSAARGGA